jgi:hypothetical protein
MLAKSADIWLSGLHASDMSAAFPAKLRGKDIKNKWLNHLKESSGIIKPPVQAG